MDQWINHQLPVVLVSATSAMTATALLTPKWSNGSAKEVLISVCA